MAEFKTRKKRNGKVTITASVRIKGHPPIYQTFDRLTDAKLWAQKTESDIRRGIRIKDCEIKKHTASELIDKYILEDLPKRKSDIDKITMHLVWWKKRIGSYFLNCIDNNMISKFATELYNTPMERKRLGSTQRSGSTVNRYCASLSICMTKGIKYKWLDENPVFGIEYYDEDNARQRILSPNELEQLVYACKKESMQLYIFVLITLFTGARYTNVRELLRSDIQLEYRYIRFRNTKNGDDVYNYIPDFLYNELSDYLKIVDINNPHIFAGKRKNTLYAVRKHFDRIIDKLGFNTEKYILKHGCPHERITPHNLRHITSSYLAMNGVTEDARARFVGQRTSSMQKRYTHYTKAFFKDTVENLTNAMLPKLCKNKFKIA